MVKKYESINEKIAHKMFNIDYRFHTYVNCNYESYQAMLWRLLITLTFSILILNRIDLLF
jgi:hypothetical protein